MNVDKNDSGLYVASYGSTTNIAVGYSNSTITAANQAQTLLGLPVNWSGQTHYESRLCPDCLHPVYDNATNCWSCGWVKDEERKCRVCNENATKSKRYSDKLGKRSIHACKEHPITSIERFMLNKFGRTVLPELRFLDPQITFKIGESDEAFGLWVSVLNGETLKEVFADWCSERGFYEAEELLRNPVESDTVKISVKLDLNSSEGNSYLPNGISIEKEEKSIPNVGNFQAWWDKLEQSDEEYEDNVD